MAEEAPDMDQPVSVHPEKATGRALKDGHDLLGRECQFFVGRYNVPRVFNEALKIPGMRPVVHVPRRNQSPPWGLPFLR